MAQPVLSHRLVLTAQAQVDQVSQEDVVRDVLARVPVPQAPTGPPPVSLDGRAADRVEVRAERNGSPVWRRAPRVQ